MINPTGCVIWNSAWVRAKDGAWTRNHRRDRSILHQVELLLQILQVYVQQLYTYDRHTLIISIANKKIVRVGNKPNPTAKKPNRN